MGSSGYFSIMGNLDWVMDEVLALIPKHETRVETCCGRGEVVWWLPSCKQMIMNDINKNTLRMHLTVKNLKAEDYERLKNFDWKLSKDTFYELQKRDVVDDIENLYKFMYLYASRMITTDVKNDYFRINKEGDVLNPITRLRTAQRKLSRVEFTNLDILDCIKTYDSENTFFFIDPPYPGRERYYIEHSVKWDKLYNLLKSLKGKYILVCTCKLPSYKEGRTSYSIKSQYFLEKIKQENNVIIKKGRVGFADMFKNCDFDEFKEWMIIYNFDTPKHVKQKQVTMFKYV